MVVNLAQVLFVVVTAFEDLFTVIGPDCHLGVPGLEPGTFRVPENALLLEDCL